MGFFAKIDENNIVTETIYISDDSDLNANEYLEQVLKIPGPWVNARLAKSSTNYAEKGSVYFAEYGAFLPPKPFPSWYVDVNDSLEYFWNSPVPPPETDNSDAFVWNEDSLSWQPAS